MKLFKLIFSLTSASLILAGCSSSEKDALDRGVAYSQNIKGNYEELGKCLLPLFKASSNEGPQTIYDPTTRMPYTSFIEIYSKKDEQNKTFNIFHSRIAPFGNTRRSWVITLKNLNAQETETLFEFKGKTLWGTPVEFSEQELKEHIAKCAKS